MVLQRTKSQQINSKTIRTRAHRDQREQDHGPSLLQGAEERETHTAMAPVSFSKLEPLCKFIYSEDAAVKENMQKLKSVFDRQKVRVMKGLQLTLACLSPAYEEVKLRTRLQLLHQHLQVFRQVDKFLSEKRSILSACNLQ